MPAYVLVFVLLGQYEPAGWTGSPPSDPAGASTVGAIFVPTVVLYPYVYPGRGAFPSSRATRWMRRARSG